VTIPRAEGALNATGAGHGTERGTRGAPGFVQNPGFPNDEKTTTSVVARRNLSTGNGGPNLTGYGVLFWHDDDDHPSYRDDLIVIGTSPHPADIMALYALYQTR
jgi:hypothetical protein